MRLPGSLFALILAISAGSSSVADARDRALVVGINQYPKLLRGGASGQFDLTGAVADAQTFASLLTDVFKVDRSDIKLLREGEASRDAILGGFEDWLIADTAAGDRVFFYYAGHGATATVTEPDGKKRLTSTIVPADAGGDLGGTGGVSGMIDGPTIGALLDRLKDRNVTVIADSCHSGSVTRDIDLKPLDERGMRTITPRAPVGMTREVFSNADRLTVKTSTRLIDADDRRAEGANIAVWGAAGLDEVAFDLPSGGPGGVFTQSFARGLRERAAAPEGVAGVTAAALLTYVKDESKTFCAARPGGCRTLTPHLTAPGDYLATNLSETRGAPVVAATAKTPVSTIKTPPTVVTPPVVDTPAQQAVADFKGMLTHKNDFDLAAAILPSPQVALGSTVAFRIRSAEAGTLVVLDAGASGKVTQLFPTQRTKAGGIPERVRPGQIVTIPEPSFGQQFRATSPGKGTLLVLVADERLDISKVLEENLSMRPVERPRAIAVELADKVQSQRIEPDINKDSGSYRYSFVAVPYEIVR